MFASYSLCAARLADIEAIDYFFARELTGLVESSNETGRERQVPCLRYPKASEEPDGAFGGAGAP